MSEEPMIDGEYRDPEPVETPKSEPEKPGGSRGATGTTLRDALRQVESIGLNLGEALSTRGNVVMVRVNDDALRCLDVLVEAEVTKSRSESAAYLIHEGIKANQALFDRIEGVARQIEDLRAQLRETVKSTGKPAA